MTYKQAIEYLRSFHNYEKNSFFSYSKELRLDRVKSLAEFLNIPYEKLNYIHIAGSKGKGSICAIVCSILVQADYKIGLFTSPHFNTVRERIRIFSPSDKKRTVPSMRGMILKEELASIVGGLKSAVEKFNSKQKYGQVTFFEIHTMIALSYFCKKEVDFAILEVGLGGRLDATNIVNPLTCGISSLSLEHQDKLGNSLQEIAIQKAGIIKKGSIVVSAPQPPEAMKVIRKKAEVEDARLYEVGKNILYEYVDSTSEKEIFNLKSLYNEYFNLTLFLLGKHQVLNAAVAVGIVEALSIYQIYLNSSVIQEGLNKVSWPGRMEKVSSEPLILLDGAQNKESAKVLKKSIKEKFNYENLYLIFSICKDKDISGVCNTLFPIADNVVLTKIKNPRAVSFRDIKELSCYKPFKTEFIENSKEALKKVLKHTKQNDLILVTGSLYLIGELRTKLKNLNN